MILLCRRAATPQFSLPAAVLMFAGVLAPAPAGAHGVLGQRFFPATISTDDPFAADEMALPTITSFDHETDYDFDYSKSIVPGFAIGVGIGYIDAKPPGERHEKGFGNLEISPTLEVYRNPGTSSSSPLASIGRSVAPEASGSPNDRPHTRLRSNSAKASAISPTA